MTESLALEPVIGLEVHAQILTESKMFCGCSAAYAGAEPNTHVCAVCAGMPGALPVINARAVQATVLTGLGLNCTVARRSKFDRKNYSYPDLPKGYQISQYDTPLCTDGFLEFAVEGVPTRCGIIRVHLEEDTGKSIHTTESGREVSLVDYNRSGVPLMEIVGKPDLGSPAAAREYFATLRQILMYLRVNDGNLQEGSLRADVNVSVRSFDGTPGTKVEIKNLNSLRAVQRALEYEIARQRRVIEGGGSVEQETRGWSERDEVTVPQRTKEYAHDYRYFPEPDLPPMTMTEARIEEITGLLPELPGARRARLERDLGLTAYAARVLTDERDVADYYEAAVRAEPGVSPVSLANWAMGELLRLLKDEGIPPAEHALSPAHFAGLVRLVETGAIGSTAGKSLLETIWHTGEDPDTAAERLDLLQVSDESRLSELVDRVLSENPAIVAQYRGGKSKAIQALIGKAMGASRGRADPQQVAAILRARLDPGN